MTAPKPYWMFLRYAHCDRDAFWVWAIPHTALGAWANPPPLLRSEISPPVLVRGLARGLCEAFEQEHGDPDRPHFWLDPRDGVEHATDRASVAWAKLSTGATRAKGWGPAKSFEWLSEKIKAEIPLAPKPLGPFPLSVYSGGFFAQSQFYRSLARQASCEIEAGALGLASAPAPISCMRKRRL